MLRPNSKIRFTLNNLEMVGTITDVLGSDEKPFYVVQIPKAFAVFRTSDLVRVTDDMITEVLEAEKERKGRLAQLQKSLSEWQAKLPQAKTLYARSVCERYIQERQQALDQYLAAHPDEKL